MKKLFDTYKQRMYSLGAVDTEDQNEAWYTDRHEYDGECPVVLRYRHAGHSEDGRHKAKWQKKD